MVGKEGSPKIFRDLRVEDKDLTMFTIENLILSKRGKQVEMRVVLKRKITTELLTTFLPTILLLLITFTSILFDKELFGDSLTVNLTIMLLSESQEVTCLLIAAQCTLREQLEEEKEPCGITMNHW